MIQEQLFEIQEELVEPVSDWPRPTFDRAAGAMLANEGMSKAMRAERVQHWRQLADEWLEAVPTGTMLSADTLVASVGLPDLPGEGQNRNNVLGGWFNSKARQGLIEWHGRTTKSKRPERHGNVQRIWVRT